MEKPTCPICDKELEQKGKWLVCERHNVKVKLPQKKFIKKREQRPI